MSPVPTPAPSATTESATPQPSALPPSDSAATSASHSQSPKASTSSLPAVTPPRTPVLRLELRDLSSPGAHSFLRLVHASNALQTSVSTVLSLLYAHLPAQSIPQTRSVTLILRSLPGVAYTTGLDLDGDHKEIHLSTDYVQHVPEARQKEEILGVVLHEMVHCWQHNGKGSAPGGLIEGIADWVRLKGGLAPPHWKRVVDDDTEWDAGYEKTGYFLEWLEQECGDDVVRRINEALGKGKYVGESLWMGCCGSKVEHLWERYKKSLKGNGGSKDDAATGGRVGMDGPGPIKGDPQEEKEHNQSDMQPASNADGSREATNILQDAMNTDLRSPREKARRGGNMHVPVRPRIP